ncbi:MAG: TIGR04282 family arsenosugar biosynthesis glycosyltransferase [Desulfobulbaceae bacterium]|nr:TIGR04282 family arsenosugar biosynthesis glycosyltransferase [Desulfobulbaceae bacterium]
MNSNHPPYGRLAIFTKFPKPGFAKTRLAATLGNEDAARIQQHLTEQVIKMTSPISSQCSVERVVYYTGGAEQQMKQWLGDQIALVKQQGKDLGERMFTAFLESRHKNIHRTIIIGTDCPFIDHHLLNQAFSSLTHNSLVLGPATDGGYYLVGVRTDLPQESLALLFENIAWGTDTVYQQTLTIAERLNISHFSLQPLNDIDQPADLKHLNYYPGP